MFGRGGLILQFGKEKYKVSIMAGLLLGEGVAHPTAG